MASVPSALRAARNWRGPSLRCTPSKPEPFDQPKMIGDDQRHVAGVADLAQGIGGARQSRLPSVVASVSRTQAISNPSSSPDRVSGNSARARVGGVIR